MWWHDYPYNNDFKIKVTWGKDDYFFAYALWIHPVELSDPEDLGWGDGQIKPYKAWIFKDPESTTIAFDQASFQQDIFQIFESMGFQGDMFQIDAFQAVESAGKTWIVVEDADAPSWTEDAFVAERKAIKSMP